ncbi:hypothetical protein STAS_34740 [Striga asiatica]|uniref:Topoisomerase II-associated protein PAT1 n=1 Tax=Striga asiatica TaxID=4170 RepID=A0A5A7RIJ1_STRAF|nr:hypothetical protein STAS_34740 [Striga asiatica]
MDGYGGGGDIRDSSKLQHLESFAENPTGSAVFDASQYEFFGGDVVDEVELGGLDDEEDDPTPVGFEEEEFQFGKEEEDVLGPLSEIDDLSCTFSKLNTVAGGPTNAGVRREWGSRESSSASELARDTDYSNWLDQRAFDAEPIQESPKWAPHPYSSSARFMEPNSLHRTSSYPEQQQQQQYPHHPPQGLRHQHSSEPILIPNSPFTSYPPPGGRSSHQASPNGQLNNNIPFRPQLQMSVSPHSPQFAGNLPQLPPQGLSLNSQIHNQHSNHPGLYPMNGLMPPQMMPPQRPGIQRPFQPSIPHLQAQILNQHLSASPPNFDLLPRARHSVIRHPHPGGSNWTRFKSKYMSADEIDNIHRMQLAATHSNDPYAEDYYHQAILARKSANAKLRHHFCPTNLRDNSSKPHSSDEPHPFLQVNALGRVSFSSIKRPRPLLEVESPNLSQNNSGEHAESKVSEKPLEQEPMLAARVAIEDGICLLLDVDDIDRFLQFNQLPDGGAQLRQRRQILLEGLASSMQLVDPLARNGHTVSLSPGDDFVFLRLISLPKGKKLLIRYLEVLPPGGELSRVVCMAICRNLRFLFGNTPADPELSTVVASLARAVSLCVRFLDLKPLAACLASVVCSNEHPPLRPVGHAAGDGASVILGSVLERATELLTGPRAAESCSAHQRAFWQASFDAFFGMLTKYCFNKYDSVLQQCLAASSNGSPDELAKAISREMPVELLRASLPHTSEQQRKVLLEFAQRSMPVMGFGGGS